MLLSELTFRWLSWWHYEKKSDKVIFNKTFKFVTV